MPNDYISKLLKSYAERMAPEMSLEEAERLLKTFKETFPKVADYNAKAWRTGVLGRRDTEEN